MKTNSKLLITLGIVLAFAVGFIAGIYTEYPKPSSTEGLAGTIAKVKKYRNTKATEDDIRLRDQLSENGDQLKAIQQLLSYYYVNSITRSKLIDKVVEEAEKVEGLEKNIAFNIRELKSYSVFLNNSRADLLAALFAIEDIKENNPAFIRNTTNQAINIVMQVRYRNVAVLEFIDNLENYINQNQDLATQELKNSYNQLAINELRNAILTNDERRAKLISSYNLDLGAPQGNIAQEAKSIAQKDIEQLSAVYTDSETLSRIVALDSERLGWFFDSESLESFWSSEALQLFDTEKLGVFMADFESLAGIIIADSEELSFI